LRNASRNRCGGCSLGLSASASLRLRPHMMRNLAIERGKARAMGNGWKDYSLARTRDQTGSTLARPA
jgi:hypothetical protein